MKISYRLVKKQDLETIVNLEAEAFNMEKSFVLKDMVARIDNYPDTFVVAEDSEVNKVVGYIFGPAFGKRYIEDEIYFKNHPNYQEDKYQMILSLVVDKNYRHHQIGTTLLSELENIAKNQNREALSLTCLDELIPFYELSGYRSEGVAKDLPRVDEEIMYNMVKEIK